MNRTLIKIFLMVIFSFFSMTIMYAKVDTNVIKESELTKRGKLLSSQQQDAYFVMLVNEIVPKQFRKELISYTSNFTLGQRLLVLAQASIESHNWTKMVSILPNKNGTLDYGPLGINENNLKDPWFMSKYWPYELEKQQKLTKKVNKNILYMVTCINLLTDLHTKYGSSEEILIAYNAGPNALKSGKIPTRSIQYIGWVNDSLKSITARFDDIALSEMFNELKTDAFASGSIRSNSYLAAVQNISRDVPGIIPDEVQNARFGGHPEHPLNERRKMYVAIDFEWTLTRSWIEILTSALVEGGPEVSSGTERVVFAM